MSATAPAFDPRVRDLLREAARWRLLGRLFECPSEAWRSDVEIAASSETATSARSPSQEIRGLASM